MALKRILLTIRDRRTRTRFPAEVRVRNPLRSGQGIFRHFRQGFGHGHGQTQFHGFGLGDEQTPNLGRDLRVGHGFEDAYL